MDTPVLHTLYLHTESSTQALAQQFARILKKGDCIALSGDLGVGKSTFARAVIQAVAGSQIEVPSPTFTLMQHYQLPAFDIIHADLYRLETPEDVYSVGLLDLIVNRVCLMEWPERLQGNLPVDTLYMNWQMGNTETQRILTLSGLGDWQHRLQFIQENVP